jgi:hypothetical protein
VHNNIIRIPSAGSSMPETFARYLEHGRTLARNADLNWDILLDEKGVAKKGESWDLRKLVKDGNPAQSKLRTFSNVPKALIEMVSQGLLPKTACVATRPVSVHWQDLIKAYAINHLLVSRLSMQYLAGTTAMLRLVATVSNKEAWRLDADDIRQCMSVAKVVQPSGQIHVMIGAFVKTVFDAYHLLDACPVYPLISGSRASGPQGYRAAKYLKKESELGDRLSHRKAEEKLPEMRAFWEFMRIVFTEKPRTFMDAMRFAQGRVLTITGIRIGELSFLPVDWKRIVNYRDRDGVAAGERGGFSHSLCLRHFAEKQSGHKRDAGSLFETSQHVPAMFEEILTETLNEVERLTDPMRKNLKAQCETGRFFPMYSPNTLISVEDFYLHTTGMSLFREIPEDASQIHIDRYRHNFSLKHLDELVEYQRASSYHFRNALYVFAIRLRKKGLTFRSGNLQHLCAQFVLVSEAEAFLREQTPTKLSDTTPFRLDNGRHVQPWEFLFLVPKRAVGEGRNQVPCHVGHNLGIGIATPEMLAASMSSCDTDSDSLFRNYGLTEADRNLSLKSHSLRHLQSTELFRLGVADTIITKRFNRRSVAQSYEYDHRSLQEELEQITLPDEWDAFLGPRAASVAKLIQAGRTNGPIVMEYERLKATEGDESAYGFLKGEVDGFHATPYGLCLNSFTVDPCPTHLECFNGCGHLSATDLPENRRHLIQLQGKLKDALEAATAKPTKSVGRENQIAHAESRLKGVERLLNTPIGERVFPGGPDLSDVSRKNPPPSVLHGT